MKRRLLPLLAVFTVQSMADPVSSFWFSGAEINRYELTQSRYGEAHPGHAELIFVTEPFLINQQVKDEIGAGPSTDVLKLNALRTFNTGIYAYRTMTSTFQPIDLQTYPHALKNNTSIQDWCGHAFQQLNKTPSGWSGELRSYFQNFGDQSFDLQDAFLEDALWLRLRLNPNTLPIGDVSLIPGGVSTRLEHREVQPENARATLESDGKQSTYTVEYTSIERRLILHFDTAFPHIIRAWEEGSPGGMTKAALTHRLMNSEYWLHNHPDDVQKRRSLGLDPIPN